ncbi:hypothetical protein HK405_007791, partial [Cladochytrium tenue]
MAAATVAAMAENARLLLDPPTLRLVWSQWLNVVYGFALVLVNVGISEVFGLGLESTILIAAVRCVIQLSLMGMVLKPVFENEGALLVSALAVGMMTISAVEVVYNKSKARFAHMFPSVWLAISASTLVVSFV